MIKTYPYLFKSYFVFHVVNAFSAYANLAISFIASILYLIQCYALKRKDAGGFYHKLPPLECLEKTVFLPLRRGVPFLLFASTQGRSGKALR